MSEYSDPEELDGAWAEWDRRHAELPEVINKPCSECPWVRGCIPGWLGPFTPDEWIALAHSDEPIACHKTIKEDESWDGARQCAGAAIFRSNVFKLPRHPKVVTLSSDRELVFGNNAEFIEYHEVEMQGSDLKVVVGSGEWSALYDMTKPDGMLLVVGDHYLIEEWIYSLLGIDEVHSNDFLDATGQAAGAAQTFGEFLRRVLQREADEAEAERLEAEAAALTARAGELRGKK